MARLDKFEEIARSAYKFTEADPLAAAGTHPFEERNIHPDFPTQVRDLYDNGHYAQSAFEALKFLDEEVQRIAKSKQFGSALMMSVFGGTTPILALNQGKSASDMNEQEGYKFLFAGTMLGIRNPRGHTTRITDDPDICLDHLSLASMLLRKLERARLR